MCKIKHTFFLVVFFLFLSYHVAFSSTKEVSKESLLKTGLNFGKKVDDNVIIKTKKKIFSIPELESKRCSVDSAKIMDINHDNIPDLVSFINQKCTSDPVEIFVLISLNKESYLAQRLSTYHGTLNKDVMDLNGNGNIEIVVRSEMEGEGTGAIAFYWPEIYTWNGKKFTRSSEKEYVKYYLEAYLPEISARMSKALASLKEKDVKYKRIAMHILHDCNAALRRVSELYQSDDQRRAGENQDTNDAPQRQE